MCSVFIYMSKRSLPSEVPASPYPLRLWTHWDFIQQISDVSNSGMLLHGANKWVGPTLICHSSSNSPHISLSSCYELITNENNNHKHNIILIKDRLPKHFALPFIILKVRGPVRHKQILRRNKDYKNQRDVLLQINITDRPWGSKAALSALEDLFIFFKERKGFSHMEWSGDCCELLDVHLTEVNSIIKSTYTQNKQHHKTNEQCR